MLSLQPGMLAYAFAIFLLYRICLFFYRRAQFRDFQRRQDCADPVDLSGSFPYGLNRINKIRNARHTGEDILDDILGPDLAQAPTFQMTMVEGSNIITTAEPANLQAMLATQFSDYDTGKMRHNQFWTVLGRSIFSSDGAFWAHSRALLRPHFARDNINDLEATNVAARLFVQALGSVDDRGWIGALDVKPFVFNFTMDTSTSFLFGESVGSQSAMMGKQRATDPINVESNPAKNIANHAVSAQFEEAFATASDYTIYRLRLVSLYWMADGFKFRRAARTLHNFTSHFVRGALESTATDKSPSTSTGHQSLLYRLATQTKDKDELWAQATAVVFAGRDTTAALICWCLMRLAQHPDIYTELRDAVLESFGEREHLTEAPAFATLKACRPLQHFISEVLRLHPPIPFNNRVANKLTTLPRGGGTEGERPIAVRDGQSVAFSMYHMHRRKDLWGEDALSFRPERWVDGKLRAWQFLPFSGGPRICFEQQFSLTETGCLLVRIVQEFDRMEPVGWENVDKVKKGMGLTMWPREGVNIRLHRAWIKSYILLGIPWLRPKFLILPWKSTCHDNFA